MDIKPITSSIIRTPDVTKPLTSPAPKTPVADEKIKSTDAYKYYSKWPRLAPVIDDPSKLINYIKLMRQQASITIGGASRDFTDQAVRASQALQDLYGIDINSLPPR